MGAHNGYFRRQPPALYFKLNSAFTCAVTVTLCRKFLGRSRRSRIGRRGHRPHAGHGYPGILKGVDRGVREVSNGSARRTSQRVSRVSCPPVRVFDRFVLGFIHILERVAQGLGLADIGVGELLRDGADLRKIFQLERDIGGDAISNDSLLRLPFIGGLNGKKSNRRGLGSIPLLRSTCRTCSRFFAALSKAAGDVCFCTDTLN
jgi:hypothetical protein